MTETSPVPTSSSAAGDTQRAPLPIVTARILHPVGVALVVAIVSTATLVALVTLVLATGGGIPILAGVLGGAAIALVLLLRLLFRVLRTPSGWPAAIVITLADIAVYLALFVTGTAAPSIVSLGPEVFITAVAFASGAASTIGQSGWWRVLGIIGVIALLWLAFTPVSAAR